MRAKREVKLAWLTVVTSCALFVLGLMNEQLFSSLNFFEDFFQIEEHPARSQLSRREDGPFFVYSQPVQPTLKQLELGSNALTLFKTADRSKRNSLADSIIAGRNLIGLTKEQATGYLGTSEDNHPYRYNADSDGLFYDVTRDEDWCLMCISFKKGYVSEVCLRVNN